MRTIDFTPFFRSSVGFDRMANLLDAAYRAEGSNQTGYPPYNIARTDSDHYRISMAVAGFSEADIDVTVKENTLAVTGKIAAQDGGKETTFLHRGIATRAFEQRFDLADHIVVTGASMENGLLHIDLVREVPEEKKPRKIAIGSRPHTVIDNSSAAA